MRASEERTCTILLCGFGAHPAQQDITHRLDAHAPMQTEEAAKAVISEVGTWVGVVLVDFSPSQPSKASDTLALGCQCCANAAAGRLHDLICPAIVQRRYTCQVV
jgi:hypothetical protein